MYCQNCGQQIPDGVAFCPHCGAKQEQSDSQVSNTAPIYQKSVESYNAASSSGQKVDQTPYLIWSIIIALLCCLPLGIPAIVFACKISSFNNTGDYTRAQDAARKAKIWTIVCGIVGIIIDIVIVILYVMALQASTAAILSY